MTKLRLYAGRLLAALLIFSLLLIPGMDAFSAGTTEANGSDLKILQPVAGDDLNVLIENGIIQGDGKSLRLDDHLTYAEAATLLVRTYAQNKWQYIWDVQALFKAETTDPLASFDNWYQFVDPAAWYTPYFERLDAMGFRFARDSHPYAPISWDVFQKAHTHLLKSLLTGTTLVFSEKLDTPSLKETTESLIADTYESELIAIISHPAGHSIPISRKDAFERTGKILHRLFDHLDARAPGDDEANKNEEANKNGEDSSMLTSFQVREETSEQGAWLKAVKRVVISRDMPNPGYTLEVSRIDLDHQTKTATIYVRILSPDPNKMYPQVITTRETKAFVPVDFKVEIKTASTLDPFQKTLPKFPPTLPSLQQGDKSAEKKDRGVNRSI